MTDLAKVQKKKRKINVAGYLFILPAMLFFCLYILYPIFFIVKNSLLKWATLSNMEFVGLENFIKVFQDSTFWEKFNSLDCSYSACSGNSWIFSGICN